MTKNARAKTLKSIRNLSVAITGLCWIPQADLARLIGKQGGHTVPGYEVTPSTAVLVRGASKSWKYKKFGSKEAKAAQRIKNGQSIMVVPDDEFRKLLETGHPAAVADIIAGQPVEWLRPPPKRVFDEITKFSGSLDREYTANGRREQGYLRAQLFEGMSICACGICKREFPVELLVAAHIKPRSKCTLAERRDVANIVFPLCLFGCDSLYERGIISVDRNGCVTVAEFRLTKSVSQYLKNIKGNKCEYWAEQNARYFRWHFERRFRD